METNKAFQMLEEDVSKLSRMGRTLFGLWQDKLSEHFQKGCLDEMDRKWKEFRTEAEHLLRELEKNQKEIEEHRERCKER
jgi:hypothetical protein